jgi:hypothetical protein
VVTVETEAIQVASDVQAVTGGSVRPGSLKAVDIFSEIEPELAQLEKRRVALPPAKRQRVAFDLEESHGGGPPDPGVTVTQKAINNQVWIWGAIILLILGYVTLRRR